MIPGALLLLCALAVGEKTELRFAPAEGTKVRRTITLDHALVVQEMATITASGAQSSQEKISLDTHQVLRTLDEYRKIGDARPLLLQRRFDEVGWTGKFELPQGKEEVKGVSPLGGTSVVYTWIPEEQDYGKYYDARESPEEVLLHLEEDLDLRALLPAAAVATGEGWSVPAAKLQDVFAPAGRLDLRFDAKRTRMNLLRTLRCGLAGNYGEFFGGESTGECKLKLASVGEEQGRKLATVELEIKLENKIDQRGLQQSQMSGAEIANGYQCKSAPVTWTFEGKGTLLWDLRANRAASFQLHGNQNLLIVTELVIGQQAPVTQRISFAGGLAFDWRFEDPSVVSPPADPPKPQGQK